MNAPLTADPLQSTPHPAPWLARLALGVERRGARSVLVRRAHCGPLRLQKALYPEGDAVCHAIVLHPPAGIAGGDALTIEADIGPAAHALITTPGAGKWYRSDGATAALTQTLRVAAGGICEWLPQENIVFDRARARLDTRVELAADARYIGMEMTAFGRHGGGERFTAGHYAQSTRIRVAGRTVWREQGRIDGGGTLLHAPAGLAGQPVSGTLLALGPGLDAALLPACRALSPRRGDGALTLLPDLLVARYLGDSVEAGRAWFEHLWSVLRPALAGRPAQRPRIWNT